MAQAVPFASVALVLAAVAQVVMAQQPGHQKQNVHPPLQTSTCSGSAASAGCTQQKQSIVLDSNWAWAHKAGDYHNCYTGDQWDPTLCPDPVTCAQNCALDAGDISDYENTYGISTAGNALKLEFVKKTQYGSNVGSRVYLLQDTNTYQMFKLKGMEFTFDVDVSQLPCGLNGALYFVSMDADGGMSKYPNNKAGAEYGTGYGDAQCPHDLKFINGEANILSWTPDPSDPSTGTGKYGTCATEMDIWESNTMATAVTPHPCASNVQQNGQTRCEGVDCGDGADRYNGICDKDGGDFNPFRAGDENFFGPGPQFVVDSTQKITVVTQFITSNGAPSGDLVEIKRFYVQNGRVIPTRPFFVGGKRFNSVTDDYVNTQKALYNDTNSYAKQGGLKAMGAAMEHGMVLVMSLWADDEAHMLWLDSDYPASKAASVPGVARGNCSTSSGVPADVEAKYPNAYVSYSNIKFGPINSTFPAA